MRIEVASQALEAMQAAARDAAGREACGILLGEGVRIAQFCPAANVHRSPDSHFEIDPQALIDAHRTARGGGLQVIGYFHSHPTGDPSPSREDEKQAAGDGAIWAIAACSDEVRFWRSSPTGFVALSYVIVKGQNDAV